MGDDWVLTAETPCGACDEPAFAGGNVVLCSRCDTYQHLRCWTQAGRCAARAKCKGKPVHVAVVKLEAPGPSAAEIAAAVEVRIHDVVHPLVADLRSVVAHAEDVDKLRKAVQASADNTDKVRETVEAARRDLEARLERLRQLVTAVEAKLAAAPVPAVPGDVAAAANDLRAAMDAAFERLGGAAVAALAPVDALRAEFTSEIHGVLAAVEACRWDTGARRHPLPWDEQSDDVLAPTGAPKVRE